MGCAASVEQSPLPAEDGPCEFILKWTVSGNYNVMSKDKKKWLTIGGSKKSGFKLETLGSAKSCLAKCTMEEKALQVHRSEDWTGDSDDSAFSTDELFDFTAAKRALKLRWAFGTKVIVHDGEGTKELARMAFKGKGKSRAIREQDDNCASQAAVICDTLFKKTYYKLHREQDGKTAMPLTTRHGEFEDFQRTWSCDNFEVTYNAIPGIDEVMVSSKVGSWSENLMLAFALAYFMHPAVQKSMESTLIGLCCDKLDEKK